MNETGRGKSKDKEKEQGRVGDGGYLLRILVT